jgi:N-methylhydantoinase A
MKMTRSVAMRYVGQSFEIDTRWSKGFKAAFHEAHRERYGYADKSRPTEIVSLRLRAAGVTDKPRLAHSSLTARLKTKPSRAASVYLAERAASVPVYAREDLRAGAKFQGPAIITEYSSTTLVTAGRTVEVDSWMNLIIA